LIGEDEVTIRAADCDPDQIVKGSKFNLEYQCVEGGENSLHMYQEYWGVWNVRLSMHGVV